MALTVYLNSFSYLKSGIPEDSTGNGGGFVFDCRFILNPGRKDEFKFLTGKDTEVIKFLDGTELMQEFLKSVYEIIDKAVMNYTERNFTSLMISFGCTGGQHRSVYAAEKTLQHIAGKFPEVTVNLRHIQIEKDLNLKA
ncbi:MAG: ATP-binding protein [Ignavibacteria bacterium]|nr:ATP-binding protein [Ignavibacteria bacterium]